MQDLTQQTLFVGMDVHTAASGKVTSTTSGDFVTMENFQRVTFLFVTGTVTVGGKIGIKKAQSKSGTTSAEITSAWIGSVDYTGSAGTYTTAATSASSGKYMTVANSDDSKVIYATFSAANLSASYPYVGAFFKSSAWSAVIVGTYILHNGRYQQAATPDPTA